MATTTPHSQTVRSAADRRTLFRTHRGVTVEYLDP